ncbi:MAG TPA: right-handed parallel beta-helix repeat-containing protein [Bacteroidota bacterium]|nr:right-handed parallel beta-helix repeat-containing protein [Bacteroidota bacterium]
MTDPAILARLSPAARGHVVATDLRAQGVTEYGEITPKGPPPMELFVNGKRMTIARYPNEGWLRIADVPQTGDTMYNGGLEREKRFNGVPAGRHYGRITYDGNEPSRWAPANDIYLHGYWTFDWSDSYQRVQSIDTVKHEITLRPPHHWYGYTKNQRYYVMNVLEELDSPGEWYLDRTHGILYLWPPEEIREAVVSMLREPFVTLTDCPNVRVEGISFEYTRGRGVAITRGHDDVVARCTFAEMGGEAVWVDGGFHDGVISCDMYDLGLGAIFLRGGDRKTLSPGGHYAEDNDIHDFSTWLRTGQYAVIFEGVGQRMSHNLIYNSPFEGVTFRGNDMLIEYNEFHDLMKETGDAGAIHVGRDWTWQGNVIRYNYFHDLKGPGLHGVMGVYLDDWASGFTVTGNLFYRAGRATMIGGGRFNSVTENVYVECSPSVHVDARGLGWASYYFDGTTNELFAEMDSMHYNRPPYSTRYPGLLKMEDSTPAVPKYNTIERNMSYGGRWMDVYDYLAFDLSVVTIRDNLIGDPILLRRRKDGEKGWDPYYLDIDMKEGFVALPNGDPGAARTFSGNVIVNGNPGVRDPAKGDFSLVEGSVAARLGFKPVPTGEMGLRRER